jgi:DNA damage-inducible protein 1
MRVTVKDVQKNLTFEIEVEPMTTIDVLKLKISAMQNISYNIIDLNFKGSDLKNSSATLQSLDVLPGSLIELNRRQGAPAKNLSLVTEAKKIVESHLKDPQLLERLCETDPEMAEAVLTEDPNEVVKLLQNRKPAPTQQGSNMRPQNNNTGFNFNFNPQTPNQSLRQNNVSNSFDSSFTNYGNTSFDPDTQKKIEDQIQMQRWNQLQAETYENYPELFIPTEMLFIKGKINNKETEIFIDTGAQTTVISRDFAERSNILKNVDSRYKTLILGVGNQMSLGRIWQIYVEIQNRFFVFSAVVLENFSHDILLGLDMMKRHRCVIDLAAHKLRFGLEGVEADFLKDHEVAALKDQSLENKITKIQQELKVDRTTATQLLQENHMNDQQAIVQYRKNNPK